MTLRLPIDLREAVTEEARVAGDLSRGGSFRRPFLCELSKRPYLDRH